jgi:urease accessory protein
MLQLIHGPLGDADPSRAEVALRVERLTLAKRLWRGTAEDGAEFGFELDGPLKDGEVVWQTTTARYVVRQIPEAVVEISLEVAPSAAAGIGWAIGNLHLELSAELTRLLAPDEPAVRQLLDRLKVPFKATTVVFRPGRFARGNLPTQELGPGHKHGKAEGLNAESQSLQT